MATLTATNPTLVDLATRMDPDQKIATVVELLNATNEVLAEMSWQEGNLPTGHRTTIRTGIPTPTWRKLNAGVAPNKSTTAQITHNTGMLEAYAEVDKALADLNGNTAAFRLSEDRPFIEGMNQEFTSTLFYGNETSEPEAFTGLTPYYNSLSAESAENIIAGGGAGTDNASIWLVVWGPNTIHGIVPKGSTAGLKHTDKGQVTIEDADGSGGRMEAYRTHYRMDAGLAVRDWRYAVRIPNIDKSALNVTWTSGVFSTSSADLTDLMFQAVTQIPNLGMGRASWYMSRNTLSFVRRQASAKTQGSTITSENVGGEFKESFLNIPMRRVDALAADEALVS